VTPLGGPDEVGTFLDNAPHAYVLMLRSDDDRMRATGDDLVEVSGRPAIVGRSGTEPGSQPLYGIGYRAIRSPVMVPIQISFPTCSAEVEA
jgi:hypothetical protein